MTREGGRAWWGGALLALLLLRALRALHSSVFYESLATLRLNETAFWLLALLLPLAAPFVPDRSVRAILLVGGLGAASLPFLRFADAFLPVAAISSGLLLVVLLVVARDAALVRGLFAGVAIDLAILVVAESRDPTMSVWGAILALAATLGAAWLARPTPRAQKTSLVAGLAFGALLLAEVAFLSNAWGIARWTGTSAHLVAASSIAGLLAGAILARSASALLVALGALGILDVAFARSPLVPLSLAIAQAAIVASAARLGPRANGVTFALLFAPVSFFLVFYRDPFGPEWRHAFPLLAALPLVLAIPFALPARPPRAGLGAAVFCAVLVVSSAIGLPDPAPPEEDGSITVVTYNVHQAFGNRGALDPALYLDVLRDLDPDVVILQESDTARIHAGNFDLIAYLAKELRMDLAYGTAGIAFLSRYPFVSLPENDSFEGSVWYDAVAIDIDGTHVLLQGVHFAWSRAVRLDQTAFVVAAARAFGGPSIVGGDFNTCPAARCFGNSPSDGTYDELRTSYDDTWVLAGHARDDPSGNTHSAGNPIRRIDMIFTNGFEAREAFRVWDARTRAGSDHLPFVARLVLAAP